MTALILIVDDDPIQRRLLEAMARRFGYDAECVEFGRSGARAPRGERPAAGQSPDPRPRHARSRRHGRAGADAPARHRRPRDRADGAWLDRGRHLRDARGRDRFRRQAGRRRAPAGVDPQCVARRCARGRTATRDAAQRRRTQLSRHRHPRRIDGAHRPARRARRQVEHPRSDRRRIRRRQGTDGARDPGRLRPARQTVRHRQLRRAAGDAGRIHPVRAREGRVHRGDRQACGQVRRGERRDAVPRRDRRTAA